MYVEMFADLARVDPIVPVCHEQLADLFKRFLRNDKWDPFELTFLREERKGGIAWSIALVRGDGGTDEHDDG